MRLDELKKIIIDYKSALSCIEYLKFINQYNDSENKLIMKLFNKTIDDNYKIIEKKKEYLTISVKTLERYIQQEFSEAYPNAKISLYYTENEITNTYQSSKYTYIDQTYYHRLILSYTKENKYNAITLLLSKEYLPLSEQNRTLNKKINIADLIRIGSNDIDELINNACWKAVNDIIENKYSIKCIDDSILI